MSCKIVFNTNNTIKDILSPSGAVSTLFKQIAKNPHIKSLEEGLEIYKNMFSNKVDIKQEIFNVSPSTSSNYANMTEDGKGNFVFYHYSDSQRDVIDPTKYGSNPNNITSKAEVADIATVGGVSMFYTDRNVAEPGVGNNKHMIKVPKNRVYDFNTDAENLIVEARELFEKTNPGKAFALNAQLAFVTKVAEGKGYDMVVAEWGDGKTRAQSTLKMTPSDVQVQEGNTITRTFRETYKSNTEKGYKAIIPESKSSLLRKLYLKINQERNSQQKYDNLYRLYENYSKMSQEEISDLIEQSDINQDLKDEYFDAANSEEQVRTTFVPEPVLEYRNPAGDVFSTFKEALNNTSEGVIDAVIDAANDAVKLFEINANTNVKSVSGFINNYIKSGLLSEERIIENGQSFLKAEGSTDAVQVVNEFIIDEDAKLHLGTAHRTVKEGKITLSEGKGKILLDTKSGEELVSFADLETMSNDEIVDKFEDADLVLISKAVKEDILDRTFGATNEEIKPQLSERELQIRLLSLLEKMGVKVVTIADYVKNSKTRNGVEPSATGLADIANQIIALKNGEGDVNALTEETAHFIVEAWNEGDISNLLRVIDKTEEYKEFSNTYRDVYSKQGATAEEVETLVRKEVLGKVLAKSLATNFSTENKTEIQFNIINFIKDLFIDFIGKVSNMFQTNDEVSLSKFTSQVNDLLLNQNINNYLNLNNFGEKKFTMYQVTPNSGSSTIDDLLRQSKGLLYILQQQEKNLLKADKGLKSNVKRLKDLEQQMDGALVKDSIIELLSTAKRQAKYITEAADVANKNGNFLTNEEGIVFQSLKEAMSPMLSEVKNYLVRENQSENKNIIHEIDNVILEVSDIVGKMKTQDGRILNSIIDRMMVRHSLPESVRERLRAATTTALNDTTAFYATFGQLSHARDPILNLAGTIIHDLTFDANINFLRRTKSFQSSIEKLGFKEKDLQQFFDNGYIIDAKDWAAFHEKEENISATLLKEVTGSTMSVEDIIKYKKDPKLFSEVDRSQHPILNTPEQNFEYSRRYREAMAPYVETVFDNQYYQDEQDKYTKYQISNATIRERKDLSIDRGVLLSRVKDIAGRVRFTNQDKIDLNALNIKRKKLKSFYTTMGIVKEGLSITKGELTKKVDENNPDIIESNGNIVQIDRNSASQDAIIAFDLHKLDVLYQAENRDNPTSLSIEFLDEIKLIEQTEGREEALEFFRLNSNVNFSDEYWNSLDSNNSLADRLRGIEGTETLIYQLEEQSKKRKQIIKQYQSQQDASNTLVSEMPVEVRNEVLSLSEDIDRLFLEASKLLKDERSDDEISVTENTPNEAYYAEVRDLDFQDKLDFLLANMTATNKRRVLDFSYSLDDMERGKTLTKGRQNIYNRYNTGDKEATLIKYAESKLAPYYVRFAPKGFSEFQNRLENSTESIGSIANEMNNNPLLQITNNYSYYKAEEQAYRNKNYKSDFEGGFFQPKIDMFKNQKFEDLFNPTIVDGEVESVGKNEKLYELYKEMLDYHRGSLAAVGELGTHNLWKAPQISKTGVNKFVDLIGGKDRTGTIKESIKDFLFYRVDDQAYGQEIDGESTVKTLGTKYIPKYYLKDLENKNDVSQDLFYSMTAFGQQAYLYESRKNYFSDMMAIQDSLLKREYPEGKTAEASSTVKMFKSYMDGYLFGIKESKQLRVTLPIVGQVDLTKNIRFIHTWVMNRNLGFNAIIPITSWVTAEANTIMEKYVKEYLNPYSTNLARAEFLSLSTDAIKDSLEINSKAKLNVMGEHYGIYDVTGRYQNSIYSKTLRSIPKVGMILNEAANFPIIPRVMLSVLYDYRVVGGDIINFNQFEKIQKDAGMDKTSIVAEWKTLEDKAFYNYIKADETSVTYDLQRLKADSNSTLSDLEFEQFVNEKEKAITTRVREVVKIVDGQIPAYERSAAQRHFFLSFFTTHRGWLAIAYARRFKNQHLNFQTGQEEQGSYRTLGNFLQRGLSGLYRDGFKDFIKNAKEDWMEASDIERNNMKRVMIELAFLQGIVAIGWVIAQMAADDDNKDLYALQLTNYLYFRLMNETTSSQLAIGSQFYELVKSPIVGADTVKSIFSISEYYNTDEIKTGRYAGMYKFQKQLMSVVPGYKSAIDLANPKEAYDSYKHFNPSVEAYNPTLWALEATKSEE